MMENVESKPAEESFEVKKAAMYMCSDGSVFQSSVDAEDHQTRLNFQGRARKLAADIFGTNDFYDDDARRDVMDLDDLAEVFVKYRLQILEALE